MALAAFGCIFLFIIFSSRDPELQKILKSFNFVASPNITKSITLAKLLVVTPSSEEIKTNPIEEIESKPIAPETTSETPIAPETTSTSEQVEVKPSALSKLSIAPETCQNQHGTNTTLSHQDIAEAIQEMLSQNPEEVRFASLGQALYKKAVEQNKYLVTVQIGAMDGASNDPLWGMFVVGDASLSHWMPLAIEPVPKNYENLQLNYKKLQESNNLPCPILARGAVSYDTSNEERMCPFCRFDLDSELENCIGHPDWMTLQIGTLDCAYSKLFFGINFDDCIIQDPLPCAPVGETVEKHGLPQRGVAMVQIDVEGYEAVIIPNMLKDTAKDDLPPIIHFEHKVMYEKDRLNGTTTRMNDTFAILENAGYKLYDQGEDTLALLVA